MAKAVIGASLIAAGAALVLATGGLGAIVDAAMMGSMLAALGTAAGVGAAAVAIGATMEISSIADALTNTVTTPQTVRSPAAPWQVIYGNVRCGGTQIDINSYGDNFKYCDMVIVLACHPCVGVQQHTEVIPGDATFPSYGGLYINGQGMQWRNNAQGGSDAPGSAGYDINGTPYGYTTSNDIQDLNQNHYSTGAHVYMESYHGTGKSYNKGSAVGNQVSQFYITEGPRGHWDSTCTMMIDPTGAYSADGLPKGFTYVYLRLLYSSTLWSGGLPESLRFDVRGKSDIWDPRLSGGAGGYAYTNNAALVIADYMCNPYFGMGYKMADFNAAALIAAANICDTQIPLGAGGTIAQYTINGTFTTNENPANILKTMLEACGGDISFIGGEWFIFPGTYVYPTATIDSSMMLGPIQVKTGKKGRDLINAVKGVFVCPAATDTFGSPNIFLNEQPSIFNGQWQKQAFPPYAMDPQHGYGSDQWLAMDGQKLYKELDLPFTTSAATAQRLAKQALLKNRIGNGLENSLNKGLSFTVECNLRAYNIVPHDTVWVNYPRFNWTAPPAGFSVPVTDLPDYIYTEFEVTDAKLSLKEEDGKPPVPVYELTLRATSPDIYLWNGPDELTMTDNKYPQFANTMQIAGPTSLAVLSNASTAVLNPDGTQLAAILATWTPPADGYVLNAGNLYVQIMPVPIPTQTYTSTAVSGGGVSNVITLSGTGNPYSAGSRLLLNLGISGSNWNATVLEVSGMTCTLLQAPPVAVSGAAILAAGWQTVAQLEGQSSKFLITGLVVGEQYYVQVYSQNSAGITSDPAIAGPVTATNGTSTPGAIPYPILPAPIQTAIDGTGNVNNVGGTGAGTVLGNINSALTSVLLQNPNFAAGNIGWTLGADWNIQNGVPCVAGSSFNGAWHSATSATSSIVNDAVIPIAPGGILSAACWIIGASGATAGRVVVRINFYDLSGTSLAHTEGNPINTIGTWFQSRVVATAPASTAYATVDCAVFSGTGSWFICGFVAGILPTSIDDVPDGTGRFAAVELGADKTLNHVVTSEIFGPPSSVSGFGPLTLFAWIVIANDPSDVFNLDADIAAQFPVSDTLQLYGFVDGVTRFGYGQCTSQNSTYPQSVPFLGSATGLSPGTHTITLTTDSGGVFSHSIIADTCYAILQQISH